MILEGIRITADALADDVIGVNARIDKLKQDDGDPKPPDVLKVWDTTRHPQAVTGQVGPEPCLIVSQERPVVVDGERGTIYRDADDLAIAIRYATGKADVAVAMRDGLYTLRAILESIEELAKNENVAKRTRNSVCLDVIQRLVYGQLLEEMTDGRVTAAVIVGWHARDIKAAA